MLLLCSSAFVRAAEPAAPILFLPRLANMGNQIELHVNYNTMAKTARTRTTYYSSRMLSL